MTSNEITFRDMILRFRELTREVVRYWYIPAFCMLLACAYQLYKYSKFVPLYPASITFNVDEDEGGSGSGLAGMLGQFGLAGVRPTRYNLDKILALSKSRRVIQETLFSKIAIEGKNDFLANHILREYKLNEGFPKDNPVEGGFYFTHDSLPVFTKDENKMVLTLYGFIVGPPDKPKDALLSADYNEDTNIMTLSASTTDEALSLALAQRMFESLSRYYIDKSIEKLSKTYDLVTHKRDSVLAELKSAEYQLASFRDTHRGLLMRTDQINELRLQREITALTAMYGEVLKNVEVADFSLKNKMPFIQVIDTPILPITPTQISLLRKLLIGLIAGGAIGSLFVVSRYFIRNAISS